MIIQAYIGAHELSQQSRRYIPYETLKAAHDTKMAYIVMLKALLRRGDLVTDIQNDNGIDAMDILLNSRHGATVAFAHELDKIIKLLSS